MAVAARLEAQRRWIAPQNGRPLAALKGGCPAKQPGCQRSGTDISRASGAGRPVAVLCRRGRGSLTATGPVARQWSSNAQLGDMRTFGRTRLRAFSGAVGPGGASPPTVARVGSEQRGVAQGGGVAPGAGTMPGDPDASMRTQCWRHDAGDQPHTAVARRCRPSPSGRLMVATPALNIRCSTPQPSSAGNVHSSCPAARKPSRTAAAVATAWALSPCTQML